jgi:hypothetical protein
MIPADSIIAIGAVALAGLIVAAGFALRGWQGWLELRKLEIASNTGAFTDPATPRAGGRIEIADLKERVRKLEQIASGIDL